jgi:hypothetical protein
MPRPTVRTEIFDPELAAVIMRLFGTIPNAQRRLGLVGLVSYNDFRCAMTNRYLPPEAADLIHDHARAWLRQWIKGVGDRKETRRELTFDLLED